METRCILIDGTLTVSGCITGNCGAFGVGNKRENVKEEILYRAH